MRSKYDFMKFTFAPLPPIQSAYYTDDGGYVYYATGELEANGELLHSITVDFTCYPDGRNIFECGGVQRTDISLDSFFKLRDNCIALLKKKQLVF